MKVQFAFAGAFCAALVASTASASVTFSFASDTNPDGPTFMGMGELENPVNQLFDGTEGLTPVDLIVDVNGDLAGGATTFSTYFSFEADVTDYQSVGFGGGFIHLWEASGAFTFTDISSGAEVLTIDFSNAAFTNFGPNSGEMGTSSAVITSDSVDGGLTFTAGSALAPLGIGPNDLAFDESFAFTLTNMLVMEDPGMPLHIGTQYGEWVHHWISEGSFSASATLVPAPGAIALLGVAALVGRRRRRALVG